MNRRDFMVTTGLLSGSVCMSACGGNNNGNNQAAPSGAVTLYYEFRIAGPELQGMIGAVKAYTSELAGKTGYLSLSLKQMIGESTMVKNLPVGLKGVLKTAFLDAAKIGRRPFVYTLFIRFDSYDNLLASGAKSWFSNTIEPKLFAYKPGNPPVKTPIVLDYYEGVYVTVAAGDATGIYKTQEEIRTFLKNQKDIANPQYRPIPANGTSSGVSITVENHVTIHDNDTQAMNEKAGALLTVAQQTYQPSSNPENGTSGTLANSNYRKAITTEIMQNAFSSGDTRNYIMHGVWESVGDHENSHIDPRFMQAAGPVGAYVIAGPVEPFYQTAILHNNNA